MKGKDICKRIRELRLSMKLTQSQFAELVNLSEDSIGKIERGVTISKIETLNKLAAGLKIPVTELMTFSKERRVQGPSKALSDLMNYLKTRPTDDIKFIHELAVKILEREK